MTRVSVSEAKAGFSEYINRAAYGNERIIIVSRGKPKAAMIGIEAWRRFEAWETATGVSSKNQRLLTLLDAPPDDDKDVDWWRDFDRELAENRLTFRDVEAE
jgi:prevent-host-death family protein